MEFSWKTQSLKDAGMIYHWGNYNIINNFVQGKYNIIDNFTTMYHHTQTCGLYYMPASNLATSTVEKILRGAGLM